MNEGRMLERGGREWIRSCNGSIVSPHALLLPSSDHWRHVFLLETDGLKRISIGASREMEVGGGGK